MPDVYISHVGVESKMLDERFTQTELSTLKADLAKMYEETRLKDERLAQLHEIVRVLSENLNHVTRVLDISTDAEAIKAARGRKRIVSP